MNRISAQKYNEFIRGLSLRNIYLKKGSVDFKTENFGVIRDPIIDFEINCSYKHSGDGMFRVQGDHKLVIKQKGQRKTDIVLRCSFVLLYASKVRISDEIFERFVRFNVPLNAWPYFREFVHNSTSRLGLPPLVLPLFKGGLPEVAERDKRKNGRASLKTPR